MVDFDKDDEAYFRSVVKDEAVIPTGLISICTWIDPESGESRWKLVNDVDMSLAECIGIMEFGKLEFIRRTTPGLFVGDDD